MGMKPEPEIRTLVECVLCPNPGETLEIFVDVSLVAVTAQMSAARPGTKLSGYATDGEPNPLAMS
jgi:hypothetical protein